MLIPFIRLSLGSLFLVLALARPTQAQYRFEHLTSAEGLSQSSVLSIFEDSRGFLWFGTVDGLNRYDGYNFQIYRHKASDPNSICGNEIMVIQEDGEQNIWIGTRSAGLAYLDQRSGKFVSITQSNSGEKLTQYDFTSLARTPDGSIWLGSNQGLFKVEPGRKTPQRVNIGTQPVYITALKTDAQGNLWLGTYHGEVYRKLASSAWFQAFSLPIRSTIERHKQVITIHENQQLQIQIGTWGAGLFQWNADNKQFEQALFFEQEFEKRNIIKGIAEDKGGNLWLATDHGAVVALGGNLQNLQHLPAQPQKLGGLSTHALQSICCDAFGNLWIGTWESGLHVYYPEAKRFTHLTQADGLLSNRVSGVIANAQHILVSTGKGMTLINRKNGQKRYLSEGTDITDLVYHQGNLAALRWNEGADFYRFTPDGLQLYAQHRDKDNPQRALLFNQKAEIIVADLGSKLFKLNLARRALEPLPNSYPGASFGVANVILESRSGHIYIGSFNQGLWSFDPAQQGLRPLGHGNVVGKEQILCLYEDYKKNLWVGTNGNGLYRYRPQTNDFEIYTTLDGLPNNVIKSIIEDQKQRLWVATNEGLCHFDPSRRSVRVYAAKDGLNGKEFMPRAAFRDEAGYLFFGGMHGLNYFHPDSLGSVKHAPKVYLRGLRVLNKTVNPQTPNSPLSASIDFTSSIKLKHQQGASLTFEFVGLFFQKNPECTYAYQLEGLDEDWNSVGTQRSVTYTNLAEGHYRFRVRAANADGVWSTQDAQVQLHVLPPWYRSWGAYLLYVLLFLGALWLYQDFVQRQSKLRAELHFKALEAERAQELEQMKSNFFTNVSHEFRTPLTLILDPIQQLMQDELPSEKAKESYGVIQRNGQRLLKLINELLDFSKIEADRYRLHIQCADVIEFLDKVVQSFQLHAEHKHLDLVFRPATEHCFAYFSADALEKIMFNLISNAIKASQPGGSITITAECIKDSDQPRRLCIKVQDQGIGISAEDQKALFSRFFQANQEHRRTQMGTGIGLALTAELVKIHGGKIEVKSEEYQGTTFTVELAIAADDFPSDWLSTEAATQPQQFYPESSPASHFSSETEGNKTQLLIVEDNEELRNYLAQQFAPQYRVLVAEDGEEGWQLAHTHLPDLVVSDLVMPKMDGLKLCKKIKTSELTSHIPMILLTSKSSVESQLQGLQIGADDYQTKPFTFSLLEARVRNLITQRQQLRQRFSKSLFLQPSQLDISETDAGFLKKVIAVIEKNIENTDFDVAQLEAALHLSQMQLYRKLTSLTAMSGNVFIRHIRLQRAKQLLAESNLSIAEIAFRVGFNSPSYFTRAYKKEFGVLPSKGFVVE